MDSSTPSDPVKQEGNRNRLQKRAPTPLKVIPPTPSPDLFSRRIPIPLLSPLLQAEDLRECHNAGVEENENESHGLEAAAGSMEVCFEKGWQHPAVPSLPKSVLPAKFML
ncbi:hypothetical protein SUGI_0858270 [Cryptomeria japonica]|nr:hypothetical protein SUGI_0858270 [Cryptomeria japonica]